MNATTYIKKILTYCLGLLMLALGVSVSKASYLGVSPVNSIPAVQSTIFDMDMGICTTIFFGIIILAQVAILGKEFKPFNLLQIVPSFVFGFFVSATNRLCDLFLPEASSYLLSILYLLVSMIFVALGLLFYLNAEVLSLPSEGLMQAITHKTHIKLSTIKIFLDWTLVIIATVLSLVCLGELNGIREGTVIAALGVGMCLKFLERIFEKPLRQFLYGAETA